MRIDCISDLHGHSPKLDGGDLLIIAGDLTARNEIHEYGWFMDWLDEQKYDCKVVIAGNHDGMIENGLVKIEGKNVHYLCDSGIEFNGYKIWGSPYTPMFCNWFFMRHRGMDIKQHWDLIPKNVDILVTHGPPFSILDACEDLDGCIQYCGCKDLHKRIVNHVKPTLHVFGHIHEGYGIKNPDEKYGNTTFINASIVNRDYQNVNPAITIDHL